MSLVFPVIFSHVLIKNQIQNYFQKHVSPWPAPLWGLEVLHWKCEVWWLLLIPTFLMMMMNAAHCDPICRLPSVSHKGAVFANVCPAAPYSVEVKTTNQRAGCSWISVLHLALLQFESSVTSEIQTLMLLNKDLSFQKKKKLNQAVVLPSLLWWLKWCEEFIRSKPHPVRHKQLRLPFLFWITNEKKTGIYRKQSNKYILNPQSISSSPFMLFLINRNIVCSLILLSFKFSRVFLLTVKVNLCLFYLLNHL